MSLNLRQMELLRAVMVTGNLTKAAQRLDVSQPAVSRMLKHMEDRLGVSLFIREHGRLSPTPEALQLNDQVERVFLNVRGVQRLSHALRKGTDHIVRIGVLPALTGFLTGPIARAVSAHPDVRVVIKVMEPAPIEANVINGDYRLGLVQTVAQEAAVSALALGRSRYVCVLPAGHRLAEHAVVAPDDLAGETLIFAGDTTSTADPLLSLLRNAAGKHSVDLESNCSYFASTLVEAGVGLAVTDPFAVDAFPDSGVVFRALDATAYVEPKIIHAQGRPLSDVERGLIDHLKQAARQRLRQLAARLPELDVSVLDEPNDSAGRANQATRDRARPAGRSRSLG